ncbi:MAG: ABC transporter substrate-binding protein [Actinobacteria bacterium]|nr:MAG: ABC transporter substrate-binding protein [Actinomycetota bacterium]
MRRFGRRAAQAAVVLGAAALAVAVATGFTSGGSSAGLAKGTIKVGYGNNLTGFLAVHDKLISNGAKLAVEQINGKGGIGGKVKIALTLEDVKSDPAVSVQVANDLIGKHVGVLVLPCNTDYQVAMANVAQRKKQFTLSPCNGDPTVAKKFPVYWPVGMAGNAQMAQLANYAKLRKYKRVYVLDSPFLYVHLMAKYFKKAAPSRGISIVGTDQIPFGATGFAGSPEGYAAIVTKIKNLSTKPNAIMTGLFSPFVDFLARELKAQGVKVPIIGSDGMDTAVDLQVGGSAVNGYGFSTFGYPDKGTATARFYSQFRKRFGASPDGTYPALGYDTIKVLEAAVLKAGSTDPKKIQAALSAGMTVNGALGPVKYKGGGQHNPTNLVVVDQIKGGKFVKVLKSVPTKVPAP